MRWMNYEMCDIYAKTVTNKRFPIKEQKGV